MKRHCRWVSVIWIPAFAILAQELPAPRVPPPDLSKAQVTVVFAPDWNRMQRTPAGDPKSSLHSLDTPPARIFSAITGGRTDSAVLPAEFIASDGMTGIRLGPESVLATTVVAGADGRIHTDCSTLPEALERLRAHSRSNSKEIRNDR